MRTTRLVLAAAALLAACNGSDDSQQPAVNSMAAAPTAYGRPAVWTVAGLNLDRGITLPSPAARCEDIAEIPGGSATQRQFTCRPTSLGDLVGEVSEDGGGWLASLRVNIPAPVVQLNLAQGPISVQLDPDKAPVTVQNFLNYVNSSFYDNTLFHRVIENFVDPGRRLLARRPEPGGEGADAAADRAGIEQRPDERSRFAGHGAHQRARTRPRASSTSTSSTIRCSTTRASRNPATPSSAR